jgi:hypothetical protein
VIDNVRGGIEFVQGPSNVPKVGISLLVIRSLCRQGFGQLDFVDAFDQKR